MDALIPDSDGDGINDEDDKCPLTAGLLKYHGCPIPDSDGDGINDEEDSCVNEAGLAELHGCPPVKEEVKAAVEMAAQDILLSLEVLNYCRVPTRRLMKW
jgi:hypothetical protein